MQLALSQYSNLGNSVTVRVSADFDFGGAEYEALFAASDATAFQHPVWMQTFFSDLAPHRGATPMVVTGRAGPDDRLVFVLPMIRRSLAGAVLVEASDLGVGDYAAPVVDRDWLASSRSDVAATIAAALPSHDVLRIRPIRDEHAALWQLFFPQSRRELDFSAHAMDLRAADPDWRGGLLPPGFRKTLERKRRKFSGAADARLRRLDDPAEAAAAIAHLARLRAGRFAGDLIAQDHVRAFYARVAAEGCAAGFAAVYALEVAGEQAGVTFAITHAGRMNYLLIGCDYARHGGLSPGLMLYDRMIHDWATNGGEVFDFTIGDEPFKRDFGTIPTRMFEIADAPTVRGRIFLALREARAWVRARRERLAAKPQRTEERKA